MNIDVDWENLLKFGGLIVGLYGVWQIGQAATGVIPWSVELAYPLVIAGVAMKLR